MKIIRKQYKRKYKNRRYYYYTRVVLFGFIKIGWAFFGYVSSNEAKLANLNFELRGYEFVNK